MLDSVDAAALKFSQNARERCATPMLQRKFVALGGVDMLIQFISMSVNDEVLISAAIALRMLEENSKDACVRVLRIGGASALLVQLRRSRNVQILVPIMGALRTLVEAWSSWSDDAEGSDEPLVDEDDEPVEVLVELLGKSEQSLRLEAAAVLYRLCSLDYDLMLRAGVAGAVAELVDIINKNNHSDDLCWVVNGLCVLVTHEPNQERFAAVHGHVSMVNLLQSTHHSDVAEQAARTLSNFMSGHKAQLQVAAAGGAQALVSVLAKCLRGDVQQVESLMQQVCAAICNLTFENDANRIKVGQVGGCDVLVRVCNLSPSYQVLEQACAAIGNICKKNRTNRSLVGMVGGCEMLLAVLSLSPPERTAVQAVRALGNVAMRAPENQLKFAAGSGLRLLVQLIATLSLRLDPEGGAVTLWGGGIHACGEQHSRHTRSTPGSPRSQQTTPRTGAGKGEAQHEETLLQLTLSALAALVAHECCRAQLCFDAATVELLKRIARVAVWPDTQAVAARLLAALSTEPTAEEGGGGAAAATARLDMLAAGSGAMLPDGKEQGGDATVHGVVEREREREEKREANISRRAGAAQAAAEASSEIMRDEWDSSDAEEAEHHMLDHHSDACSVSSHCSSRRRSVYSRGSSRASMCSSQTGSSLRASPRARRSHAREDDAGLKQEAGGDGGSSAHGSVRSSLYSSASRSSSSDGESLGVHRDLCGRMSEHDSCNNSFASLFSDDSHSDDELDVEEQHVDTSRERGGGAEGDGERGGKRESEGTGGGRKMRLGLEGWWGGSRSARGCGGGSFGITADSAEASAKVASVEQLIEARTLRLNIQDAAPMGAATQASREADRRDAGVEVCWGLAIPASPMSGDGLGGLPALLFQGIHERRLPDESEVRVFRSQRQKQQVLDAWLEVAEVLQSQKVVVQDVEQQRASRRCRASVKAWRQWLLRQDAEEEVEDSDEQDRRQDEKDEQDSEAVEEEEEGGEGAELDAGLGRSSRSTCATLFPEPSLQSVCSEESFCGDTRSGPTLPALPICCKEGMGPSGSEGIGSSVDMMTVASEASTRSLGSEQSSTSCWFEGSIPLMIPHHVES